MIAEAIIKLLLDDVGITDLVADRIEPSILKQGITYPAIYVSADRMAKLGCVVDSGVKTGTIEVGVYAQTYEEVSMIIKAVRARLDDYQGVNYGVAINIMRGVEGPDLFDDQDLKFVKIIEYDAVAQLR